MRNFELTTAISPCLRIFIESVLDEIDDTRAVSWVSPARFAPLVLNSGQEKPQPVAALIETAAKRAATEAA